jgi:hypothetical protein
MAKHHEEHPEFGELGIFAGYGELDDCSHIAIVSISETECQCMDCLRRWPKADASVEDDPEPLLKEANMRTVEIDVELLDEVLGFAIVHRDRMARMRGTKAAVAMMDEMIGKVNTILGEDSSTARRDRLMRESFRG